MKTAKEMREKAIEVKTQALKRMEERRHIFLEERIMPEIEKWANLGAFNISVSNEGYDRTELAKDLQKLGYKITICNKCIRIDWSEEK